MFTWAQWLRDIFSTGISILDSQGLDLDERLLTTLEWKSKSLASYTSDIRHHEHRRTMPSTNGKDSVTGKELIGYLYK